MPSVFVYRRRFLYIDIGNRYSGRSRGLSQMRQVVPYRRSLFRRSAMNCLSPYASLFTSCVKCIRSLRSGHKHQRFKLGLKRSEKGSPLNAPPFFRLSLRLRFPLRLCHRRTKSWAPDGASNVNRSKLQSGAFAKKYIIL